MSRRLIVRPEAEAELADAFGWYEERVSSLGAEFMLCVDAAIHAIYRNPRQWPRVHGPVRRALLRRFPYQILFVEDDEQVTVLAVFHGRRDPRRWQERLG